MQVDHDNSITKRFISDKALVVTNYHVMAIGPKASVTIRNYARFPVLGVVAMDKPRDLAIVKLRMGGKALSPLPWVEKLPRQGHDVHVFGCPQGLQNTVTRGIISAIRKVEELAEFGYAGRPGDVLLQLDAAVNPGSSGGPIVSAQGAVVGVAVLSMLQGQGLNFGVPCGYVAELLDTRHEPRPLTADRRLPTAGTHDLQPVAPTTLERDVFVHMLRVLYHTALLGQGAMSDAQRACLTSIVTDSCSQLPTDVFQADLRAARDDLTAMGSAEAAHQSLIALRAQEPGFRQFMLQACLKMAEADGYITESQITFLDSLARVYWHDLGIHLSVGD